MNMNVYFFIRAYNDLDQATPIIHRLCEKYSNINVDLISWSPTVDFSNDYRVSFLREKHQINFIHLLELESKWYRKFRFMRSVIHFYRKHYLLPIRMPEKNIYLKYTYKLLSYCHQKPFQVLIDKYYRDLGKYWRLFDFSQILQKNLIPNVFCFDQGKSPFVKSAVKFAKERKIATVIYLHGLQTLVNHYRSSHYVVPNKLPDMKPFNMFDRILVNNNIERESFCHYGIDSEKVKVAGSARYAHSWVKILKAITPGINLPNVSSAGLKVVFMLTNPTYNVFQDEIFNLIMLLANYKKLFVVVKCHTRSQSPYVFRTEQRVMLDRCKNVLLVTSNDIHSYRLIEWADLFIFTYTSIIIDALMQDKPALFLRKTMFNKLIFERFMLEWNIDCRDDLVNWINKFLEDKNTRTYSVNEAVDCVNYLTNDGDMGALDRLAEEIVKVGRLYQEGIG